MAKRIDEDGIHYRLIDVGEETYRQDYDDGNEDREPYVEEYTDEDDRYEEEA